MSGEDAIESFQNRQHLKSSILNKSDSDDENPTKNKLIHKQDRATYVPVAKQNIGASEIKNNLRATNSR